MAQYGSLRKEHQNETGFVGHGSLYLPEEVAGFTPSPLWHKIFSGESNKYPEASGSQGLVDCSEPRKWTLGGSTNPKSAWYLKDVLQIFGPDQSQKIASIGFGVPPEQDHGDLITRLELNEIHLLQLHRQRGESEPARAKRGMDLSIKKLAPFGFG